MPAMLATFEPPDSPERSPRRAPPGQQAAGRVSQREEERPATLEASHEYLHDPPGVLARLYLSKPLSKPHQAQRSKMVPRPDRTESLQGVLSLLDAWDSLTP